MAADASNKLCGLCTSILDTIREVHWHTGLIHHQSLRTLNQSANDACGICTVLLEHLQSSAFQQVSDMWDKLFPIKCESDTSSATWQSSFELTLTSDGMENLCLKFTFEAIEEFVGWYPLLRFSYNFQAYGCEKATKTGTPPHHQRILLRVGN